MISKPQKIILFNRMDSKLYPGGDTIQINAITSFLEKCGYSVTVTNDVLTNLSSYDIVMIFNLTRPFEAYLQAKASLKYNKPYILFPIYWDLDTLKMVDIFNFSLFMKKKLPRRLKSFIRSFIFWKNNKKLINQFSISFNKIIDISKVISFVLRHAYCICPNSQAELIHLINCFEVNGLREKSKIIYNGIDINKLQSRVFDIPPNINLPAKYVSCVGGIGPRKNQLMLVKAANITNIPLVIIGKSSYGCEKYANKVKKMAKDNVIFLDHLKQEEVFGVLARSHAHIQPSFIETPGLASLEAAIVGCNIGVSSTPPVKEYFGEQAFYCNPYNESSIQECLELLFHIEKKGLNERNKFQHLSWDLVLSDLKNIISNITANNN